MQWIDQVLVGDSLAGIIIAIAIAVASGIAIGHRKVKGLSLGIAMVMFTGILWSHLNWQAPSVTAYARADLTAKAERLAIKERHPGSVPGSATASATAESLVTEEAVQARVQHLVERRHVILEFVRDFGLVLFVFAVGMAVGPGFLGSLKREGLRWNALAVLNVFLAVAVAWGCLQVAGTALGGVSGTVGTLSGAITNTPGLSAAQQALSDLVKDPAVLGLAATAFAVAYPFGMLGKLTIILAFKKLWRIDFTQEQARFLASSGQAAPPLNVDLEVANPAMVGKTIHEVLSRVGQQAVISRIKRDGVVRLASQGEALRLGDMVHAVGTGPILDHLHELIGKRSAENLRLATDSKLMSKRVIVTHDEVVGKAVSGLNLLTAYGVNITRISRAGVEFVAVEDIRLNFADTVTVVGPEDAVEQVATVLGNSPKRLEHPQLVPMFVAILLGVLVGSVPILLPGIPAPVKLGLAGGPILVALALSALGRFGRLSFYMPPSANLLLKEFGISLFLVAVGLLAGEDFAAKAFTPAGVAWMTAALAIVLIPLVITVLVARYVAKLDYLAIMGLATGSTTDPPAMSFACALAGSEQPAITFATVYPLTMLLRIVTAQVFVLMLLA